jgi:hypothetical protein
LPAAVRALRAARPPAAPPRSLMNSHRLIMWRTTVEDRMLQYDLPGYATMRPVFATGCAASGDVASGSAGVN